MVQQDGLIGLVAEACAIALAIGSLVHIKLQNGTTKRTLYQVRATPSGHVRWKGASWTDVEPLEGIVISHYMHEIIGLQHTPITT